MLKNILAATAAGLIMAASLGAAAPPPAAAAAASVQQYYPGPGVYCFGPNQCFPIAYSYEVYSDAEHTNYIGGGYDTCVQSGSMIYVSSPNLPSGYEVKTPMYVCTEMGPFEPGDWNPPA